MVIARNGTAYDQHIRKSKDHLEENEFVLLLCSVMLHRLVCGDRPSIRPSEL